MAVHTYAALRCALLRRASKTLLVKLHFTRLDSCTGPSPIPAMSAVISGIIVFNVLTPDASNSRVTVT